MTYDKQAPDTPRETVLITQGEYAVTDKSDVMINTLLGSCVSCCLWDETAGVGGMNHLLLAGEAGDDATGYDGVGVAEMECLINDIIKLGGRRSHLKAKVFGGARMMEGLGKIGEKNAMFAFDYLKQEGIPCINSSVGGTSARALRFWGHTGRVSMRLVSNSVDETAISNKRVEPAGNGIELF